MLDVHVLKAFKSLDAKFELTRHTVAKELRRSYVSTYLANIDTT